jgi:hypothetical protein
MVLKAVKGPGPNDKWDLADLEWTSTGQSVIFALTARQTSVADR